ncbi:DUF3221 domain-containing protein [Priestia abyssalis]|uniref:DUF3221 domain-containing protein n=1 Tax=Priestia abyssalis TaxID=1221450 RepID=UPI00099490E9|nr:DUF3221 domain-containing protein [Priestia abyssalis]
MKRFYSFLFVLFLLVLTGCQNELTENIMTGGTKDTVDKSDNYEIQGRIVQVENSSMTVVNAVSKEMIKKYNTNEILSKRHGKAVIFSFKDTSKKFEIGQLVRVWRDKNSPILESDPPQMSASKVEIIED